MARWYYTVIVGTHPGVYTDWTQAAPKVIEISGAIHKKFRTLREAYEAYNRAAREGALRVVRIDPEPDAEWPQGREEALFPSPAPRRTIHPATGLGHCAHRRNRSMGVEIMPSMQAGPSHGTGTMGHVIIDTEPRDHHRFSQQSRPPDGAQARRPTGSSYREYSNESRQESQRRSVRPIPSSSRGTSTERRRRVLESPGTTHSRSPQSSRMTHRVMRSPQIEDNRRFPGNVSRQHGRPPSASPLADGRQNDSGPQSSDGFSFNVQSPLVNTSLYIEPPHASGSQGPIAQRTASVQSPDAHLDSFSFDWSQIQRSTPSSQNGIEIPGDPLGPPGSFRQSPARSYISLANSNETSSVFSFEVNISVAETPGSPGRSAHVASPLAPQPTVSPFAVSSSVENAIPGPSTKSQEGLNDEETEDNSQASSGDTRFETPLEHTNSPQARADRSIAFSDSPSLSRPLSPLIVASTSRSLTHLTQSIRPSGLDTTTSSSPLVWPWWSPSLPDVDPEASRPTEVTGLGLSIEGIVSPPRSHPLQHRTITRAPPGSLPHHRLAGRIEGQSSTGQGTPLRDASASQAPASPPLASAGSDLTYQSRRAKSTNGVAPSPRNVPLPSSPATSTPRSSPARLQAQPSHRSSPLMPFYPSLALAADDAPSTPPPPSGLDTIFDRPTPRLSPSRIIQEVVPPPAASRTPSADPRSPISRLARLPGSIMEISRNLFFGRTTPPRSDSDGRAIPW